MSTNKISLDFLLQEPTFDKTLVLKITPLTPLSMVSKLPGSYYHSSLEPTNQMVFGMIENLLSFHFSPDIRNQIEKRLKKEFKKSFNALPESGSGYKSILSNHIKIESINKPEETTSFEDLWSQQLKRNDKGHLNGSRNYDWRLEQKLDTLEEKLQTQYYPYYYISPTNREYILCKGSYSIALTTNKELAQRIREGLSNLNTPLYLGSNDGWIEVIAEVSDEKL
ncbi:MAG: hypothetical protein HRU80_00965 [Ignavibacteriales bacterium]|nr:MAG: hypothetical protein HRU80_00965 [Ignavibacteriales bacterium]